MDKIRWGILSTGNIAHSFAEGLKAVPDAELVAVGSRRKATADEFAREFKVPNAHGSYQALADDPNVDVIYIGTPHIFHAENIKLCLNAGKHVLCEKPFTINASEAQECIDLAAEKGLFLMEAVWMRFIPAIRRLQELINSDAIGDVTLVKVDFSFYVPPQPDHRLYNLKLGGGALLDVGIYPISFTTMLLGMPQSVHSHAIIGSTGVDEQCSMLFSYPDAAALLSAGISGELREVAVVKGTKGRIIVPARFIIPDTLILHKYGENPETISVPYHSNGYNYEVEAVHDALREGKTEHALMPLSETQATMALMDTMRSQWGLVYPGEG